MANKINNAKEIKVRKKYSRWVSGTFVTMKLWKEKKKKLKETYVKKESYVFVTLQYMSERNHFDIGKWLYQIQNCTIILYKRVQISILLFKIRE